MNMSLSEIVASVRRGEGMGPRDTHGVAIRRAPAGPRHPNCVIVLYRLRSQRDAGYADVTHGNTRYCIDAPAWRIALEVDDGSQTFAVIYRHRLNQAMDAFDTLRNWR